MTYRFLGVELDEERFELRREGRPVRLEPRALDVLFYLVRNRDRVVPKEELIERVWGVKFVSESALHHSVRKVRDALAGFTDQEVIRTVHGRGFRFVASLDGEASLPPPATEQPAPEAAQEEERKPVIPSGDTGRRILPLVLGGVALLGAVFFGLRFLSGREDATPSPGVPWYRPLAPSASTLRQMTSGLSTAVKPVFSPDGKMIAYVSYEAQDPSKLDVYVMAAHGGTAWRLTEGIAASGDIPVFTADGEEIVFSRFRTGEDGTHLPDLWRVGSMGSAPRLWLRGASGAGFSPDGKRVAYTKWEGGRTPLWGGPPLRPEEHAEIAPSGFVPRFSPDGRWLAFTTSDPNGGLGDLLVRSLESNETKVLTRDPAQLYGITWMADSETLIYAGRRRGRFVLWMASLHGARPEPLTLGIGDFSSPSASPDGATLVFAHGNDLSNLVLADRLSDVEGRRLTNDDYHQQPRLSPDGRLAVSMLTRTETEDRVVLTDLSTLRRTVLSDGAAHHPFWVDAGTAGYLVDTPDGGTDLVAVDVETLTRRTVTRFEFPAAWPAVAPGGKRVAVEEESGPGRRALVVRDLETGRDARLDEGKAYEGIRFSPDGATLAWSGPPEFGAAGINGVFALRAGGRPLRLAPDGHGAFFAAGGAALLFVRLGEFAGLWRVPAGGGAVERIRPFGRGVQVADAAGERLLWTQAGGRNQIYSVSLGR
jgi:Tol biopolymer transport system component/DNA-binding winged helix-turn-helix (wHTH) protein